MAQWDRRSRERDSSRARDTLVHVTNHESLDGCPQRACQQAGPGVPLEKRLRCMDSVVAASPPRPYICTTLVQVHQDGAAPERGDEGARMEEVGEVVGRRRHVRQVPDDGPPLRGDSDGRELRTDEREAI